MMPRDGRSVKGDEKPAPEPVAAEPAAIAADQAEIIAKAVAAGIKGAEALYRTSVKTFQPTEYKGPDEFDIKARADEIATSKGHGPISNWVELHGDPATAERRRDDPFKPRTYQAMCMTCKGKLTASWIFKTLNDPTATADGKVSFTSIGGPATQKTCRQVMLDRQRGRRTKEARFLPRGQSGATAQVG